MIKSLFLGIGHGENNEYICCVNYKFMTRYIPNDKMSDLINDNSSILMVLSRFGISLGFGGKSVNEVCKEFGVDSKTFLAVANFISRKDGGNDLGCLSLSSLMDYLKRAHAYFLDFSLPAIRRKLIEAIDCSGRDEVAFLILKYYDEYVTEVRNHMEYENLTVFTYVDELLRGRLSEQYSISVFAEKHNNIAPKLHELKDIIIRYYPHKENDLLNVVLFDIINCEQDLISHCLVEDSLFVPAVERLERQMEKQDAPEENEDDLQGNVLSVDPLSEREKEVVSFVAKGMTNKEIADKLFLSIHTITTHRRNIAAKLQIHTPAGLTIYAIVNKLVELRDIKLSEGCNGIRNC